MQAIEDLTEVSFRDVPDDTKLSEMGINSMKLTWVGSYIEKTTGKPMFKDEVIELTVGKLKTLLNVKQQ